MLLGSPDVSLYLSPVIWILLWLVASGSPDASLLVSSCLLFFGSQSGWWCLVPWMCLFTCLPSFLSHFVQWCPALRMSFLCFHLSLIICFESSFCLCGGFRLFRLFASVCLPSCVSHHLSPTWSVSDVICLQSYVCLSCGVLFWFYHDFNHLCFVFVSVLYFLNPFVSSCCLTIKSCSTTVLCVLPCFTTYLISQLSPTLSPSYCLRYKWRGKKSKPRGMRTCCLWFILCLIDMDAWTKNCHQKELVASLTPNMHTDAAMDME